MTYAGSTFVGEAVVGPKGCKIEKEDCYVLFPPGSVHGDEHVSLELHGDCCDSCPDGFAAITPKLVCKTQRDVHLCSAVEVKLSSWCFVEPNEDDVIVHIVRSDVSGTRAIDKCSLKKQRLEIIFKTDVLSSFWAQIQSIVCDKVQLRLDPGLYYNENGTFSTILMSRGVISKEIRQKIESDGNVRVSVTPNIFTVKNGDDITIAMKVESMEDSDVFRCEPHLARFIVDEDFLRRPQKYLQQQIRPCPKPGQFLGFDYTVTQNDKRSRQSFSLSWPGTEPPPPPRSFMDEED